MEGGFLVLLLGANLTAALLGMLAVGWYNGIYTPLKRITAFAVVPGAIVGALPPAIGWVAGGQSLGDMRLLALGFFFFMWQIPHFWILTVRCGSDYQAARIPSLTAIFSSAQLARITFGTGWRPRQPRPSCCLSFAPLVLLPSSG